MAQRSENIGSGIGNRADSASATEHRRGARGDAGGARAARCADRAPNPGRRVGDDRAAGRRAGRHDQRGAALAISGAVERFGAYDESFFDNLLYPDRGIFEYWCHAASILPMSDYPMYRAMMLEAERLLYDDYRHWAEEHPEIVAATTNAIRERGPLASADFARPNDGRRAKRGTGMA